jgi:2-polyprenyl-3-methyl-5-hydroxy-6-metoxy-1,4-benzoquinol methylase
MNVEFRLSIDPCLACKSTRFIELFDSKRSVTFSKSDQTNFDQRLECCYDCGLIRQENNDSYSDINLQTYYSKTFRTPINIGNLAKGDRRLINASSRLRFIQSLKEKGSLLEVGFGDGAFLREAAKRYSCTGLDPSIEYKYIHESLIREGVEISNKTLSEFTNRKKFDIVCSFLVLEHIKNPLRFIRHQIRNLAPNGILIVEVPDIRKYSSFNSDSVLTYEHVFHYCKETLVFLLSKLNLKLIAFENENVAYGFSLIAAFKLVKNYRSRSRIDGFEVVKLFQEFLAFRIRYRDRMRTALKKMFQEIEEDGKRIVIYGAGYLFNYALNNCELDLQKVDSIFDDTTGKLGTKIQGKIICPLTTLSLENLGAILIFSEMFFEEMKNNIMKYTGNKDIKIINIHHLSID